MRKRGSALESSSSTDPVGFAFGRLGKPNGLDGFLGLYADAADLAHLQPGSIVHIRNVPYTLRAIRHGKKGPQVAFEEVTDRASADELRGMDVFIARRRQLDEGEFWPEDLVGLEVRPGGGRVAEVLHGPTQARLVIEREAVTFEVPFVDELVPTVDVEAGYLELNEIEGLTGQSDQW